MSGPAKEQPGSGHDIVVVGGSAGVADAMLDLLKQLPASFPAAIFLAYHMPPGMNGAMERVLAGAGTLKVKIAEDGEPIRKGIVYVARNDRHLLVEKETVRVTRGPRENRWRPAIDPLFRSAAVAYGSRVIGIILTGMLDDGTAGLLAIKRCGGLTVVQDPHDATHPGMPQSAIDNVPVDYRLEVKDMGAALRRLAAEPAGPSAPVPHELQEEARVSAQGVPVSASAPPRPSQFVCPECGGPLHKQEEPGEKIGRYRCLVGHGWGTSTLLSNTNDHLESTVWAAIRLFRQRGQLLLTQAEREHELGRERAEHHYRELADESLAHATRLQELILGSLHLDEVAAEEPQAEASGNARRVRSAGA